ncbi:MAG TPA: helicase-associated domain-containing protein [Deltaproteobacteria bacterium]|jgi:DNA excision repair protein ERCC-3|nr:helicase-associated domain-containing protein [Deltaproteobacteria bacterium]OQC27190.1 MAG: Type III restriction enzyme, res subunit [Deltaproteobacteria bacterium ADurb.Bin072]HRW80271.1 helicase-associated domain-containing protein [Desulfomonilia bacterium]HNQ85658.1 helicase-associated domain-containing protein [Deltaproteobacteria bacterium]HNS89875.1 helicase-associated domain-containing protein [Deltaproteobacteria bacterium]
MYTPDKPLIIQSDGSILLEVLSGVYEEARDAILPFAELIKSPEYVHTYRITPLSLWNAAAMGISHEEVLEGLTRYARYDIPHTVVSRIAEAFDRWDAVRLYRQDTDTLRVEVRSDGLLNQLMAKREIAQVIVDHVPPGGFLIPSGIRGRFKHNLIKMGYPVHDLVGYDRGDDLDVDLRGQTASEQAFSLRPYQVEAADSYWAGGSPQGGQGIVVLPCGAGKTIVGMAVMARARTHTLILCTNVSAVHQWMGELLDKTTVRREDIGEYTGSRKEIRPVTVTTYQMLTFRRTKDGPFEHMNLMMARNWGLIVYDEVHVVPAPVFRATTELQAKRRLGLTATLIREDGLEQDTFSLVGPKCYDVPWKELEQKGFIAEAVCCEVRVPLPPEKAPEYVHASDKIQFRIASENANKELVLRDLLRKHADEPVLVIGQYLSQLRKISSSLKAPMITGATANARRDLIYESFRRGEIPVLVVSKVANFAIDLPDASVAIQVSGTFGSRQEEAQRLGRILRPKERISTFYTLVTKETSEEIFAHKRQVFLAEQGYKYRIEEWSLDDLDV